MADDTKPTDVQSLPKVEAAPEVVAIASETTEQPALNDEDAMDVEAKDAPDEGMLRRVFMHSDDLLRVY